MRNFVIYTGNMRAHTIQASSAAEAVERWLSMMGYETLEEAARENWCTPEEIEARSEEDEDDREFFDEFD